MSGNLNSVIARARRSRYYREAIPGDRQVKWETLPLTQKQDLRDQYPFGFLATSQSKVVSYHESSGTEGRPISSYFTKKDWKDIAERFNRNAIALTSGDVFFIKTPYSMVTTAHQAQRAGEMAGALIVPGDNRSLNMPLSRVIQLLRDLEVTVTWSLPTEVIFWALAAREAGMDPKRDFPKLRAFWVAGEILSPAKKQLLEKLWGGKRVYEDYGSTETGSLAGECALGRLHAWSDRVHFEVLDTASGLLHPSGRGQLVVTPLYREAMPLIRYNTEDEVDFNYGPCPCGSELPLIEVTGRASNLLTINGIRIRTRDIEDAIYEAGLPYDLTLFKAVYDSVGLEITFHSDFPEACAIAIQQALHARLQVDAKVEARALCEFVPNDLFKQKLNFNKPQFFLHKEEAKKTLIYY